MRRHHHTLALACTLHVVSVHINDLKTRGKSRSSVKDGALRALLPRAGNSLRQATM